MRRYLLGRRFCLLLLGGDTRKILLLYTERLIATIPKLLGTNAC